ncbi:MAG: hypothetical protein WD768_14885 [Phycisphaeraceae bacterium]
MTEPSLHHKPVPSPWLVGMSALWMLIYITGALIGALNAVRGRFEFADIAVGVGVFFAGAALAYVLYAAVFRRCLGPATLMTVLHLVLSGASGLPLFLVVFVTVSGENPHVLGVAATISLFSPVVTISMAVLLLRWTRKLEEHHRTRPYCNNCGYNLIGSLRGGQNRCPECGAFASPAQVAIHGSSEDSTAHADPSD